MPSPETQAFMEAAVDAVIFFASTRLAAMRFAEVGLQHCAMGRGYWFP